MENHTKRIRKARRQGLARRKDLAAPSPRTETRRRRVQGPDVPGVPRPNTRRTTLVTNRKTKRQARTNMRRIRTRVAPMA